MPAGAPGHAPQISQLKTGDGIVCPSCLLPRERIFVDTQINGSVGALLAEEARREEWQLDEP